jgi:hypothetical protein
MDDKTTYKCSVCEKILSKKSNFQRHYNNIHQETKLQEIFICHHCEKQFKSKFNLIRHFSTCRKFSESRFQVSKRVKCALCNYENSRQTYPQSVGILVIFTNSKNGKMKPKSPILLNILDTLKKNLKVKLITIIDVIVMDF